MAVQTRDPRLKGCFDPFMLAIVHPKWLNDVLHGHGCWKKQQLPKLSDDFKTLSPQSYEQYENSLQLREHVLRWSSSWGGSVNWWAALNMCFHSTMLDGHEATRNLVEQIFDHIQLEKDHLD